MKNENIDYGCIQKATEEVGGAESISIGLERCSANARFLKSNYDSLLARHSNRWIAIFGEKVVATTTTQEELISLLEELSIDPKVCYMKFLDPSPMPQILIITTRREISPFILCLSA